MKKIIGLVSVISLLMACHGSVTVGDTKYDSDSGVTKVVNIKNNIQIKENGLKVSEAYLVKTDGSKITDENSIGIHDNISLRLVVSGWKEIDGRVKPGASEKIVGEDGTVALNRKDLFNELSDASAKDAKFITIDAEFKDSKKSFDHVDVFFRVWDKVSNAEVSGSYKLNMK